MASVVHAVVGSLAIAAIVLVSMLVLKSEAEIVVLIAVLDVTPVAAVGILLILNLVVTATLIPSLVPKENSVISIL